MEIRMPSLRAPLGFAAALALTALGACLNPMPPDGAFECGSSKRCPRGYVCDERVGDRGVCVHALGAGGDDMAITPGTAPDMSSAITTTDCETFCVCMPQTCPGTFANAQACLTACSGYTALQQNCVAVHCGLAKMASTPNDQAVHCTHAAGTDGPPKTCL